MKPFSILFLRLAVVFLVLGICYNAGVGYAQVGIGTVSPVVNAQLDVRSNDKGLLVPRLTTSARTALGSALASANDILNSGMQVYDTDTRKLYLWNENTDSWDEVSTGSASGPWTESGGNVYLNTLTNNVGIGTGTPGRTLDVNGSVTIQGGSLSLGTTGIGPSGVFMSGALGTMTIKMDRNSAGIGQFLEIEAGGSQVGALNSAGGPLRLSAGISTGSSNGSDIQFFTSTPGVFGTTDNPQSQKMVIRANGNVGIGTLFPTHTLDVTGTTLLRGTVEIQGGDLALTNATSNLLRFTTDGLGAPTFTTRSPGTKMVLFPSISGTATDYALGIQNNSMWYSIDQALSTKAHVFYAGTTELMRIRGDGNVHVNNSFGAGYSSYTGNGGAPALNMDVSNCTYVLTITDNNAKVLNLPAANQAPAGRILYIRRVHNFFAGPVTIKAFGSDIIEAPTGNFATWGLNNTAGSRGVTLVSNGVDRWTVVSVM